MSSNYFDEKEKKFFLILEDKSIDYSILYSNLIKLKKNNLKQTMVLILNKLFILKVLEIINDNAFTFKLSKSLQLYIYGKKKIFFEDNDGNIDGDIYVYNDDQLIKIQEYFIEKSNNKKIEFFDQYNNLITEEEKYDPIIFFEKAHKLKAVDNLSETTTKEIQFKNLFNAYIDDKFANNGERLSFNFSDYTGQNPMEFEYIETTSREEMFSELKGFIKSRENYRAITGVSGTGKTITLLQFLNRLSKDYPKCYLNIKILSKLPSITKLASEFVKLFYKENYYKYYQELIKLIEEKNNLSIWDKIIHILDYIIEKNEIRTKIIIVIDQYKISCDPNFKLIEIIQSVKYSSRIKFIICSSIHEDDIKSNITYSFLSKKLKLNKIFFYKFVNELFSVEDIIKNDAIKTMMKQFNYIPKYYYLFINKYHKDEENIENKDFLNEQINNFLSFQFNNLELKLKNFFTENDIDLIEEYNNICQILQGKLIKRSNFPSIIHMIPLKYCIYNNKDDNNIQISPAFDFIYGPLRKVYKQETILDMIAIANINKIKNRGELGNIFDNLVNCHFDIGKKCFGFDISHVIIVNEIIDFSYIKKIIHEEKDYFYEQINYNNLFDQKVIYLEQYNSNGKYVDGGFLIPLENGSYGLLLYQSSIRKRNHFQKDFIYNIIYETTKNNITQTFGIDIKKMFFMYIIDTDDQTTAKFCNETGIYYIYYNYESSKFLYNNYKEIKGFNNDIFDKMEIQKPDDKIIDLLKSQDESNDLSTVKKYFLGKKRDLKRSEEEEIIINKELNQIKNKIKFVKSKFGYKNENAKLIKGDAISYKKSSKEQNNPKENELKLEKIPENWKLIFEEYNSYKILKIKSLVSNAIFQLPIFYIYNKKYIIVKNGDNKKEKYSIYDYETGNKLEGKNREKALDLLNIFSDNSDEILCLDVCCLEKR